MDEAGKAAELQRRTAYDVGPLLADAPPASPRSAAAVRLGRLMPITAGEGPVPEFCSYHTARGKRCDELARWRERDGSLGYCHRHRASAGLDDPQA